MAATIDTEGRLMRRGWGRRALLACIAMAATVQASAGAQAVAAAHGLPVWSSDQARQDRYVAAHGLRGFAGGYAEDGLEFWAFPLQIVSGYQLEFLADGRAVRGLDVLEGVDVDLLGVTRRYQGDGFRVVERIQTQGRLPGVGVSLRVEGRDDLKVRVHLRPSLNLMWPAAIGGQEFGWDTQARGFLLNEPSGKFRALIASPQAGAHTAPNNDRRGSEFGRSIFMELTPAPCGSARCATLALAGQSEPAEDIHATAAALLAPAKHAATDDASRFAIADWVRITTPDAEVNRALQWAQIAVEQAWTCNARLGCGMVAGYGPSHGARRPQYAWYFAGDGLLTTRSLIHQGRYDRAAEQLAFILRYQHPDNGMIWHEMSQSAGFLDWARDYHYMYVHVDIAFDLVATAAEYVRASGDTTFLARHWPALQKAYGYCLSTLDAGDGLPRVPAEMMSANEQDDLGDELTLSAAWVDASQAMSSLATLHGDPALAKAAAQASERARTSLRARYRDTARQRWISGFSRSGHPGESTSAADMAAITSGAATPDEARATLARLSSPDYLTAWGLRSTPASAADYDPQAYAKGSVWGLGTAAAAGALWGVGEHDLANRLWLSLVPWAGHDALGHMHEVMAGDAFVPQRESVPEQTWSSASFLSAAMEGMLGLDVDAAGRTLHFVPQPPTQWTSLRVERLRLGEGRVDLAWRRTAQGDELEIDNRGAPFHLHWARGVADGEPTLERQVPAGRTRLRLP
jgi:hypothetical protein